MRRWIWKGPIELLIAAVAVLGAPVAAEAAPPVWLLPDGESLGEAHDVEDETESLGHHGPCLTESHPEGYGHAKIYRVTASASSLLRVWVADDTEDSLSLCMVSVHEAGEDESGLPDSEPLAATDGCATGSTCSLEKWLDDGKTYDVVFWATPPESGAGPDEAEFLFDASVKLPGPTLYAKVYGHRIKDLCTGYHEVRWAMPYTISATSTSVSTGTVTMTFQKKSGSSWYPYATYNRALSAGATSLSLTAGSTGAFRITASLPETDTQLGASKTVYVSHVTPKWHRYSDGGVRLKVPWYHQQMRLSCEAATLRMAHNYFKPGHIDTDWAILKLTGVDDRPKKGNRWGNPNKTFVGKPNGKMMKTGYGVHYGPIASASSKLNGCRPPIVLKYPSRATISRYVAAGFPVIVWGAHSGASGIYKYKWKAWDGSSVTAWSVEHVWVIVGFHGKAWKPTSFIVHNPSGGANRKVSLKSFDAFFKYFKRAVVVRG